MIDLGCPGGYLVPYRKAKGPLQWRRQVTNRQAVCRDLRRVAAPNRRLHIILSAPITNPEDCRERSKRSIERVTQSIMRSPSVPSGYSRHDDCCWKATRPSVSAV